MDHFHAYGHALVSVALFAIMTQVLSVLSASRKAADGVVSGALPAPDYANSSYRLSRAYMNAMEHSGPFIGATVASILAGASPFWVNLLASLFLISRLVTAVVHIRGIGRADMGLRTMLFAFGLACSIILAILAIGAVML